MIEVEGPGGVVVEFPDGTPRTTIEAAMSARFNTAKQEQPTLGQKAASTAADVVAGIGGWPGSLINAAREYIPGVSSFVQPVPGVQDLRMALADNGPLSIPIIAPETGAGKQFQAGLEGGLIGLPFGPLGALAGIYSGLTSETAGQVTQGSAAEPYARIAGAFLPMGVGFARGLGSRAFAPATSQQEVAQAMQMGPVTVGDVMGGGAKAIEGTLSRAAISGAPLRDIAQRQGAAIAGQVDDIARQISPNTPNTAREAGQSLQGSISNPGGIGANEKLSRAGQILYNREVYRHIPRDTAVTPSSASQAIDDAVARINNPAVLSSEPWAGLPQIKQMLSGQVNMSNLPAIKQAIWGYRNAARDAGQGDAASVFGQIYKSLDNDVVSSINAISPQAAAGYQRANQIQQGMIDLRDKINQFIGSASNRATPEQAINSLITDVSRGRGADAATLQALRRTLPKEGFNEVRSFMLKNLGVANDGTFDRAAFVRNWDKLTPEARTALFDLKPDQFAAINRVMNYARQVKPEVLNPSGTTGASIDVASGSAALAGAATSTINPAVALGIAAIPRIFASGLSSQTVARAINSSAFRAAMASPKANPQQALQAFTTGLRQAGASDLEIYQVLNQGNTQSQQ